jgi:dihydroflavonol-4-reductase
MMKVLITGASGYIGKHITLHLLNSGFEVLASVRNLAKAEEVRSAVLPHLEERFAANPQLDFIELDLEQDKGWDQALQGVDVLMHTASPFPIASPKNEMDLISPAVNGTLRALKAAHSAGISRVILTSSVAAIYGTDLPEGMTAFDETVFTDVTHPVGKQAYTKSKALAEQAAWEYVRSEAPEIQLTTINPVLVLGAPLDSNFGSSVSVIQRIIKGKDPMFPDLSFSIVHVKDVARMHVEAIKLDTTRSQRFIASAGAMTFIEIARCLESAFPGRKFRKPQAPTFILRLLALFDGEIKAVLPLVGDRTPVSSRKAEDMFSMKFISAEETIVETAQFLLSQKSV